MGTPCADDRFRAIADAALDIIFIIDADGSVSYVNDAAMRWLGKPSQDIIGHRQHELFAPATAERQDAAIREVLRTGQPLATEQVSDIGGTPRILDTRLAPLRDAAGTITAVLGVSRDTTDVRTATESLRRSEERFRALVEHSDEVIIINDLAGKRLYVSSSVERVLGYTPQEYLAMTIFDMAYPDDIPALRKLFAEAPAKPRTPIQITFRIRHKDDSWHWIHAVVTNLSDLPAIGGLVINLHDITELRHAQELQARAAELERITTIMTGRELKMTELKAELERLRAECAPFLKTEKGA